VRVDGDRVVVSNVNLVKRHTKPNPQANQPGGMVERERSIHISNVDAVQPGDGQGRSRSVSRCWRMDANARVPLQR
jgi:large subunit ribosomal protein L24